MAAEKPNLVHVEIFGQTYAVRAGAEPGYVEQLAAYVDEQMREVSKSAGAVDSVRVAVLAALNIADECFRLRRRRRTSARRGRSAGPTRSPASSTPSLRRVSAMTLVLPARGGYHARRSPALFVMDSEALNQRP